MGDRVAQHPVVLVHGLWYGRAGLVLLDRRLQKAGFPVRRFSYPALRQSLSADARALRDFIIQNDCDQLSLVGHSLGGLVILRMLDEYAGIPPGRVVLLGSPVRGSRVARRAGARRLFRPLIGPVRPELEAGFSQAPAGRETAVIAGSRSFGLGRLFGSLDTPDDGTVSLSECRLDNARVCVFPVTHTGLVTAPGVARAVAGFLATGRFPDSP